MKGMILACTACDSRYDLTGYPEGQKFRCRCGTILELHAPSDEAGQLACPQCGAGCSPTSGTCAHCNTELLLKACPRCLSRIFHGHKHCPECGAESGLAAVGATHADMPCPRCTTALRGRMVGDLLIDECPGCQGLFLDHIAIKRVVMDHQHERADALLGALPKQEIHERGSAEKMYLKCPTCHVVMNRKQFATGAGVVIDVCRAHGTFFDVGELPRIIEFVMSGGMQRANERDARRLHAEVQKAQLQAAMPGSWAAQTTSSHGALTKGAAIVGFLASLLE
jgi:Zn-finger nucleic acid-binding protein